MPRKLPSTPIRQVVQVAHRWGLVLIVGLLLVSFWALILWLGGLQKERVMADGARELAVANDSAAQQVDSLFKAIDADLRIMDLWLQSNPGIDPARDPGFCRVTQEMRLAAGGILDFHLASNDGRRFAIPPPGSRAIEAPDEPAGVAAPSVSEGVETLHIGAPTSDSEHRNGHLPVSRRLTAPAGRAAVLVAEIDLEALARSQDQIRAHPTLSIVILRGDGRVISRVPFDRRLVGTRLSAVPNDPFDSRTAESGSFVTAGRPSDGAPTLVNFRRLEAYPLVVMATRELGDMLSDYVSRRQLVFGLCAALTLSAVSVAAFLQRLQKALEQAQEALERLASIDHLTDVMNRRALSELAEREFSRAQRLRHPVSVLALDIDHFKRVNDTHGHAAGDVVLKECARRWKASLRAHDLLGRMGGEEFCVLLPETPLEGAWQVAQRLRKAVIEPPIPGLAQVTVSIGLGVCEPGDAQWTMALDRADKALYRAKAAGRDRVVSGPTPI